MERLRFKSITVIRKRSEIVRPASTISTLGEAELTEPEDRAARLAETRNLKMARSAHAYVRGSTAKFYEWLEAGRSNAPDGPPVWICGDCHVGNLGPLADVKGRIAVQIRDLDQTVIGNPAHDLIRLGLSLASAVRGSDLPGVTTARMLEALVAGYAAALDEPYDEEDESYRPKTIQTLLKQATRRRWRHLAEERLDTVKPVIPLGKRFWALTDPERAGLEALFHQADLQKALSALQGKGEDAPVEMVDAAYWMKGCSSLGRLRYAVMLRVGEGDAAKLCLVDVKEAVKAAAPQAVAGPTPIPKMPRDNAERVVAGGRALSPNLGKRMFAGRMLQTPVVVRELMPQDLKIEVENLTRDEATALAGYLAGVVGRAHGRQMDAVTRDAWRAELSKARTTDLDAPNWLWTSVVDLLAVHEAAYLEHCRRYALAHAA